MKLDDLIVLFVWLGIGLGLLSVLAISMNRGD
jgi:hypothetical protein